MTKTYDTAIVGAKVWQPTSGMTDTNIYIDGERIAALTPEALDATRVIDAKGQHILPGLIDTHTHHRDPGFTQKEDATTATAAAAAGGVTVTLAMPNVNPPTTSVETFQAQIETYTKRAIVDWNINPSASDPTILGNLAALGCLAFKVYMVVDSKRPYPHMPALGIHNNAHIYEILESAKDTGLPVMFHPNDQALFELQERRHFEQGIADPVGYGKQDWMLDCLTWTSGVATLVEINHVVGAKLHLCHMMSGRTVEHVRRAKNDGDDVTAEVNAFSLFLGTTEDTERIGPYALGRTLKPEWIAALWAGMADGTIDVLGTDHAPHTREEKEQGWTDMWKAPSGAPTIQHYLMKLLDAMHDGLISLDDIVRVTSYNPAKRFDLYPKKGTIEVGSDADLVFVDLDATHTITESDVLSKCGWTPFAGQTVRGVPRATMLRGQIVMRDFKLTVEPGYGQMAKPLHR